ncbi:MAG: peptidase [Sphingomonadaceae bacterium]
MTYCCGMLVEKGLVMMADTRTNAGVDDVSSYRKLHILCEAEERVVVACTSGNLSVTQLVVSRLEEGLPPVEPDEPPRTLANVKSMFQAAELVGEAVAAARKDVGRALLAANIDAGISLLLGGRIGKGKLRLYLIYSAGNFIECHNDAPFLQIGETKYGKPILDRALQWDTPLDEAVKVGLISFDSTMRSNLAVGRPLDLIVIPRDPAQPNIQRRIEVDDPYFDDLSARWSMLLGESRAIIPTPPFMQ